MDGETHERLQRLDTGELDPSEMTPEELRIYASMVRNIGGRIDRRLARIEILLFVMLIGGCLLFGAHLLIQILYIVDPHFGVH